MGEGCVDLFQGDDNGNGGEGGIHPLYLEGTCDAWAEGIAISLAPTHHGVPMRAEVGEGI